MKLAARRAAAFAAFDQGLRHDRAAEALGVSTRTVRRYLREWKKGAACEDRPELREECVPPTSQRASPGRLSQKRGTTMQGFETDNQADDTENPPASIELGHQEACPEEALAFLAQVAARPPIE